MCVWKKKKNSLGGKLHFGARKQFILLSSSCLLCFCCGCSAAANILRIPILVLSQRATFLGETFYMDYIVQEEEEEEVWFYHSITIPSTPYPIYPYAATRPSASNTYFLPCPVSVIFMSWLHFADFLLILCKENSLQRKQTKIVTLKSLFLWHFGHFWTLYTKNWLFTKLWVSIKKASP